MLISTKIVIDVIFLFKANFALSKNVVKVIQISSKTFWQNKLRPRGLLLDHNLGSSKNGDTSVTRKINRSICRYPSTHQTCVRPVTAHHTKNCGWKELQNCKTRTVKNRTSQEISQKKINNKIIRIKQKEVSICSSKALEKVIFIKNVNLELSCF